jgi:hypothetical protein
MPYSYAYFKNEFFEHLFENFSTDIKILDVGAGSGSYGALLKKDFERIDAIEIYRPYVLQFKLKELYNDVFIGDIREFDYSSYNYLILGDVLEHMSEDDAFSLLDSITSSNIYCMVAVPYMMEQGAVGGNEYETHLQPDLTHDIFLDRYPMMNLLYKNNEYGYYVNYRFI